MTAAADRRVDEAKVAAQMGVVGHADAAFVITQTGFSIGGVALLVHAAADGSAPVMLIDSSLFRFNAVWAAAGHPNGVFCTSPADLLRLTGAPAADVVEPA